ncbi:MAG: cysteine-rich CWC family protein [Bdellovibrionales bacterium]|nr:cysteine-rich CWC family protein [Ramlibacter sp.]
MSASPPIDPARCPLCGQRNGCAMEVERETGLEQPPCWCMTASFDAAALARIPLEARDKTCICAACASPTPATPAPT